MGLKNILFLIAISLSLPSYANTVKIFRFFYGEDRHIYNLDEQIFDALKTDAVIAEQAKMKWQTIKETQREAAPDERPSFEEMLKGQQAIWAERLRKMAPTLERVRQWMVGQQLANARSDANVVYQEIIRDVAYNVKR